MVYSSNDRNVKYLFVYGTLRRGFTNYYADLIRERAGFLGNGLINGDIYEINGYPGLIYNEHSIDTVIGDVYEFDNPEEELLLLDDYEESSARFSAPTEYIRKILPVKLNSDIVFCWVYVYNWPIDNSKKIEGGDYLTFSNA